MFSADSKKKILKKTLVAIGENEKRRQQTLQILREWIRKTPHLTSCPTSDFFFEFLKILWQFPPPPIVREKGSVSWDSNAHYRGKIAALLPTLTHANAY